MADAEIGAGARQLASIGTRLKETGNGQLRRELLAGVRNAVKPVIPDIQDSARRYLPRGGGLAGLVASQKFAARTSLASGKVSITGAGMKEMTDIEAGRLRHPVFGNRGVWKAQRVTPRFFSRPIEDHLPEVKAGIERVMSETASKITKGV